MSSTRAGVATASTPAGQKRQVLEGRANRTRSGLTAGDLTWSKSGQAVSKKKKRAASDPNSFINQANRARKANRSSFEYRGTTYHRRTKGHLVYYAKGRRS